VLLEDTAAEAGLAFALAGVGLAAVTGDPGWDAVGTLAIGVLLAVVAAVLGFEMYSLLVGEAASPAEQAAIREAILSTDGVAELVQLRTMHLGPDELLVVGGLEIERAQSAADTAAVIDAAQARVREVLPSARVIYLEPDLPAAVPEAR
jgi:divalent metal cation (Fe/Co/Zn/Cd) transporter